MWKISIEWYAAVHVLVVSDLDKGALEAGDLAYTRCFSEKIYTTSEATFNYLNGFFNNEQETLLLLHKFV